MKACLKYLCCVITVVLVMSGVIVMASGDKVETNQLSGEVVLAANCIKMPLGKILLARKDSSYCGVKLTKVWVEAEDDRYAEYESYFEGVENGEFVAERLKPRRGRLSFPKPRGLGRLAFSFGNRDIPCGTFKLAWYGDRWIYFSGTGQEQGDHGVELAPTGWTDTSQIDILDPRVKWYRYDEKRTDTVINLGEVWKGKHDVK
jgi:hypothetical protein